MASVHDGYDEAYEVGYEEGMKHLLPSYVLSEAFGITAATTTTEKKKKNRPKKYKQQWRPISAGGGGRSTPKNNHNYALIPPFAKAPPPKQLTAPLYGKPKHVVNGGPGMQVLFLDPPRAPGTGVFIPQRQRPPRITTYIKPACTPIIVPAARVIPAVSFAMPAMSSKASRKHIPVFVPPRVAQAINYAVAKMAFASIHGPKPNTICRKVCDNGPVENEDHQKVADADDNANADAAAAVEESDRC